MIFSIHNLYKLCYDNYASANQGLVAQLGEHHLDKVGVAGSNPVETIILKARQRLYKNVGGFFLSQ